MSSASSRPVPATRPAPGSVAAGAAAGVVVVGVVGGLQVSPRGGPFVDPVSGGAASVGSVGSVGSVVGVSVRTAVGSVGSVASVGAAAQDGPDSYGPLRVLAAAQGGVFLRSQALGLGWTPARIAQLVRGRQWLTAGYGALAIAADSNPDSEHLRACAGRLLRMGGDAVISHESAAVLLRLPYVTSPATPTLTLATSRTGTGRGGVRYADLPEEHRWQVGGAGSGRRQVGQPGGGGRESERGVEGGTEPQRGRGRQRRGPEASRGVPVTSAARTLVDLLRGAEDDLTAQGLADGGLRAGVQGDAVERVLDFFFGWPGIVQARAALAFAEPRCESPLESRVRIWLRNGGLATPQPQVLFPGLLDGRDVRVDFLVKGHRVVIEADGRLEYDLAPAGQFRDVLWQEKRREDALRAIGFVVVRAYWSNGRDDGRLLCQRVRDAIALAARYR